MPNYPKGPNKRRVVIWWKAKRHDWVIEGTKKDGDAFEARQRVLLESGAVAAEQRTAPAFAAFCLERYIPYVKRRWRPSTYKNKKHYWTTLMDFFGELRLTDFTAEWVEKYQDARLEEEIKPVTINCEVAALVAVLNYALKHKVPCVKPDITDLVEGESGRAKAWSEEQMAALLAEVPRTAPDILPLVLFVANTGVRKGEAIVAERAWVDVKRQMLCITPNEFWRPKNGKPRDVPLGTALLPWVSRKGPSPTHLFTSEHGTPWACWPQRAFDRCVHLAGHADACKLRTPPPTGGRLPGGKYKKITKRPKLRCTCTPSVVLQGGPHTLRHTYASHFLAAVPDMFLLAEVLGHSHTRVTKLYSHLLPSHLARARDAVSFMPATKPAANAAVLRWRPAVPA